MSCPDLETGWTAGDTQPLSWSVSGWYYDGAYGGCDGCYRRIKPDGGWEIGQRPTQVQITFTSTEAWESYGDLLFYLNTSSGEYYYQETMPEGIKSAGTHVLTFDLTDGAYLNGSLEDITELALWLGYGDGPESDRAFTITDITFDPCPGVGCTAFWTNHVGQQEVNP